MENFELYRKQYDADTKWVTQVAASIRDKNPDVEISWGECIRLAEKYLKERGKYELAAN